MEFQIKYILQVHDSKYREFLNVLEKSLDKQKPLKCVSRSATQSISDIHIFEYQEIWTDIKCLKEYMRTDDFMSLKGAFQLLTSIKNFIIVESIDIK